MKIFRGTIKHFFLTEINFYFAPLFQLFGGFLVWLSPFLPTSKILRILQWPSRRVVSVKKYAHIFVPGKLCGKGTLCRWRGGRCGWRGGRCGLYGREVGGRGRLRRVAAVGKQRRAGDKWAVMDSLTESTPNKY